MPDTILDGAGNTLLKTPASGINQGIKTVASAGTPEALGTGLYDSIVIQPRRARGTANTGAIFLGGSATNDTGQLWEMKSDASPLTFSAPPGMAIDLATIFIDVATAGDGVAWLGIR